MYNTLYVVKIQWACRMKKGQAQVITFRLSHQRHGFGEFSLHAFAKQFDHSWLGDRLDGQVVHKITPRAFKAVEQNAYGKRGKTRFKGKSQLIFSNGRTNTIA
jgi:hypothetical protein